MKALPFIFSETGFQPCSPKEATHVMLRMPGPFPDRHIPVLIEGQRHGTSCWSWNGDTEFPTLKPSILSQVDFPHKTIICHSFVTNGKVEFLSDSTHEHAGQTLDLLDVLPPSRGI